MPHEPGTGDHPVQLRIDFPRPRNPVRLALALRGDAVVGAVWEGTVEDACSHLQAVGVPVRVEPGRGIVFAVTQLSRLRDLPRLVRLEAVGSIAPLLAYATSDPVAPATVTLAGELRLGWYDGGTRHDEALDPDSAAALPASELPFVATEEAWEALERLAGTPQALGVARLNHDGFVEVTTTHPQRLESAPLAGLFRIDATHYGVSLAHTEALESTRGIEWAGAHPAPARPAAVPAAVAASLGPHLGRDLARLLGRLARLRGQVMVYPRGHGRRLVALGALAALEARPALVVCPPWSLWPWARAADVFSASVSLTSDDADIRLITHLDLALRPRLDAFEAIVFDDLTGSDAAVPEARAAMEGLAVMDAVRIGICDHWVEDPEEGCAVLNMVRPGEFELSEQPLSQRYPLRPVQRAEEHAEPYLLRHDQAGPGAEAPRRSEVELVAASADQLAALRDLGGASPAERLAHSCEVLSAGTATGISPKVAAALEVARRARSQRRRLVVATRSRRAATLLRATLAAMDPRLADEGTRLDESAELTVLLWSRTLPDLRWADEVLLLEYPWSTALLDAAVGDAALDHGPRRVAVMHSPGTVDDRLAVHSARRRQLGPTDDPVAPPDPAALEHLLARRW